MEVENSSDLKGKTSLEGSIYHWTMILGGVILSWWFDEIPSHFFLPLPGEIIQFH